MDEVLLGFTILSLCLISSAVFYVACPNQQWMSNRYITFNSGLLVSLALSVVAWYLLRETMSGLSASFTVLSIDMMWLGLLPLMSKYDKPLTNKGSGKSSLVRSESYSSHKNQWLIKIIGSVVLGFPFAVFTSSLLGWAAPNSIPDNIRSQFIMWMITPLWLTPLSLIFFTRKPFRIFIICVLLTLVAFGLLQLVKSTG